MSGGAQAAFRLVSVGDEYALYAKLFRYLGVMKCVADQAGLFRNKTGISNCFACKPELAPSEMVADAENPLKEWFNAVFF